MLSMTVCTYIWAVYYRGGEDFSLYYKLDAIDATLGLTLLPFLYLYLKLLTDETPLGWKEYILFLPAAFVGVGSFIIYAYMGKEYAAAYMGQLFLDYTKINFTIPIYKAHFIINIILYYTTFMVQTAWVGWYAIVSFTRYRKRLEGFYSNLDDKSLKHIKAVLIGYFVLMMLFVVSFFELYVYYSQPQLLLYIVSLGYAVVLYYLNYHVFRLKYTAEDLAESLRNTDKEAEERGYFADEETTDAQKLPIIKSGKRESILSQINSLLDEDKIFLKPDLRLDDVVTLTQTNRTYISSLLNEEYQCNFSELINRKRIEYAQEYALAHPHLSHHQLAENCGFTLPSSFSRVFKQYVGMTFKEWYKAASTTK